jgi:hypothetical protein
MQSSPATASILGPHILLSTHKAWNKNEIRSKSFSVDH